MNKRKSKVWRVIITFGILFSFFISVMLIIKINDIPKQLYLKQQEVINDTKEEINEHLVNKDFQNLDDIFKSFIGELKIMDLTNNQIIYDSTKDSKAKNKIVEYTKVYNLLIDQNEYENVDIYDIDFDNVKYEITLLKYKIITQEKFDNEIILIVKMVMLLVVLIVALLTALLFKFLYPLKEFKKNINKLTTFKLDEIKNDNSTSEYNILNKNIVEFSHELDIFIKKAGYKYSDLEGKLQYKNEVLSYKNRLVASLTHDLKAPLVSIKYLIKEDIIDAANIDMKVDDVIKEINDISKIVYNDTMIRLENEKFNLIELLFDSYKSYNGILQSKNIYVEFAVDEEIIIDDYRIQYKQLIHNALSNIVNYAKSGAEVKISCYLEDKVLTLSFYNDAPQLSQEQINNVFKLFYRISGKNGGLGTGMFIIKSIADSLNGEISFENTKNGVILKFIKVIK